MSNLRTLLRITTAATIAALLTSVPVNSRAAVIAVGTDTHIANPDNTDSKPKPPDNKKKKGQLDTCGYPNSSNPPRSLTVFNESECLSDFFPKESFQLGMGQTLQLWYADEHALLLGIRGDVQAGGVKKDPKHLQDTSVVKSYPHTPAPSSPTCMSNVAFGDMNATDPEGRPLYPALFITDVTATGSETAGDWQNGGHPIPPSTICGTWKYAVRVLGMTSKKDHDSTSIAVDRDPPKNNWSLGSGSDTPPGGFGRTQGYGAEVIWNVDELGLLPGHVYKLQFMVHDGDQNKSGGDVGEGCTTLTSMPGTISVSISPESQTVCASTPATLCAIVDPGNPGVRPYQFTWSTGSHDSCITVHAPANGVTNTYHVTVTDHAGHTASATGTVTGAASGTACIITGPNTICAGQPTEICGPLGATSYHWDNGDTSRCISVTAQGVYTLTITGPCGTQTCSHPLTASSPPTCSITGPDELCPGQTAELCGPQAFQGTVFTYQWSTGATTRCITINGPGNYNLTVSTPTCGSASCTHNVTAGAALACTITGPGDIDPDSTAELCGPKGTGLSYAWSTGDTSRRITIDPPGNYTLTVTSPTCGTSTCSRIVLDRPTSSCRCSFFYPDSSNLPRSTVAYHESEILAAVVPGRSGCPIGDNQLKLWYNDEFALSMGIRRVVVYNSPTDSTITGTVTMHVVF